MPRKFLKKYLPTHEQVRSYKSLGFLHSYLADRNLWRINRQSIPGALFIGIFCSFLPIPFQMVPAAVLAILFRKNVPLSLMMVWISNPVTWVPIYYFAYFIGARIIGEKIVDMPAEAHSQWDFHSLWQWFMSHYPPILVGGVICGVILGAAAYLVMDYLWQKKLEHDEAEDDDVHFGNDSDDEGKH